MAAKAAKSATLGDVCVKFHVTTDNGNRDGHVERGSPSVSLETVGPKKKRMRRTGCGMEMTRRRTGLRSKDL